MEKKYDIDDITSRYLSGEVDGTMQEDLYLGRFDTEKAYASFRKRTKAAVWRHRLIIWTRAAAACAAVAVIAGVLAFRWGQRRVTGTFTDIVVEVPAGSRTQMTLPDGSQVWLNAGSRMSYSQDFGVKERRVGLSGEGYFEVVRDEDRPFSITSQSLSVRVLGTKFDFRDYPEDGEAVVTLSEGSVSLHVLDRKQDEYVLKPGHSATFEKVTGQVRVGMKDAAAARQWTDGILVFEDLAFGEIVRQLARSYGAEISVADPVLDNLHFSAEFDVSGQTLAEVLEVLSGTHHIRYRFDGNRVEIY